MTTRSIFQKVCPSCMNTVPIDMRECSCGHVFDHDDTGSSPSSEEIRLKAEELYQNYLAARLEQATSSARAARTVYARDPANLEKSDRVSLAMREQQAAETALTEQSARIAEMKKTMRPAAPPPVPVVSKKRTAPLKPVTTSAPVRIARKVDSPAVDVALAAASRAKRTAKPTVQAPAVNTPASVTATKQPQIVQPVQTVTPNPAFRQAQSAKAEKILRAKQDTQSMAPVTEEKTPITPSVERNIVPAIFSPAPTKTAPRLYTVEKKKDCPNCTSSVDSHAARCRCGYEFSSSEQLIPPLAMSDEERAEFAKLFGFP